MNKQSSTRAPVEDCPECLTKYGDHIINRLYFSHMKDSIRVATPNATKAVSKTTAKWEETPEIDIIKELTFIDKDFEDVNSYDTELSKFNFNL